MTAPVRPQDVRIADPLPRFIERCRAKARAWHTGEISLHDAVDACQQAAEAYGLVIELGADAVQAIMVEAFVARLAGLLFVGRAVLAAGAAPARSLMTIRASRNCGN
jgi:hypothetical protein